MTDDMANVTTNSASTTGASDADANQLAGVWRSSYYKADKADDPQKVVTEHYVNLRLMGNQLIMESMPGQSDSYLLARFTVDDRVLTGSYQSQNSPNNSTKGALYYGAAQLILSEDGQTLSGMGVGFGDHMEVKSTIWTLQHVGRQQASEPTDTQPAQ